LHKQKQKHHKTQKPRNIIKLKKPQTPFLFLPLVSAFSHSFLIIVGSAAHGYGLSMSCAKKIETG